MFSEELESKVDENGLWVEDSSHLFYFGLSVKVSLIRGHVSRGLKTMRDKLCVSKEVHSRGQQDSSCERLLHVGSAVRPCGLVVRAGHVQ